MEWSAESHIEWSAESQIEWSAEGLVLQGATRWGEARAVCAAQTSRGQQACLAAHVAKNKPTCRVTQLTSFERAADKL